MRDWEKLRRACVEEGESLESLLQFSKTEPEDLDTEQEDHTADEWRYLCMSRPVTPLREVETRAVMVDPLKK